MLSRAATILRSIEAYLYDSQDLSADTLKCRQAFGYSFKLIGTVYQDRHFLFLHLGRCLPLWKG